MVASEIEPEQSCTTPKDHNIDIAKSPTGSRTGLNMIGLSEIEVT